MKIDTDSIKVNKFRDKYIDEKRWFVMKKILIDGNKFSDLEGFYTEMDKLLTKDLDWKTGHNMNAFNDLLSGGFGVHEYGEPLHIEWINFAKSRQDLGYHATKNYYQELLKKCHPSSRENVESRLQEVEECKGKTILDMIVDIILDTDDSGHWCELYTED